MKISIDAIGRKQNAYLLSMKKGGEIWCTELNLFMILQSLFSGFNILHNSSFKVQVNAVTYQYRPDFVIPDLNLIIEFQGYQHFTNSRICYSDQCRFKNMTSADLQVIAFPYFVQPSLEVVDFLFGAFTKSKSSIQDFSRGFPHGFVHPKAVVPGDFCPAGIALYKHTLSDFPDTVRIECSASLKMRALSDKVPVYIYDPYEESSVNVST